MAAIDKSARLEAQATEATEVEARQQTSLEPPFPFKVKAFDPRFFGLLNPASSKPRTH